MNKEDKILTEAKEYYSDNIKCYNAFLHGAKFAEEEIFKLIWHDSSEEPKDNDAEIIYYMENIRMLSTRSCGWLLSHYGDFGKSWNSVVEKLSIKYWAYVKDLFPYL